MPNPDLICEVRTEGGLYRDWMGLEAMWTYADEKPQRHISMRTAEPDPKKFRLIPGSKIDVYLGGQLCIQDGYIKVRRVHMDANAHVVTLVGLSKIGKVQEGSVNLPKGGELRGYGFDAIANSVLKPHGLSFRFETRPMARKTRFLWPGSYAGNWVTTMD